MTLPSSAFPNLRGYENDFFWRQIEDDFFISGWMSMPISYDYAKKSETPTTLPTTARTSSSSPSATTVERDSVPPSISPSMKHLSFKNLSIPPSKQPVISVLPTFDASNVLPTHLPSNEPTLKNSEEQNIISLNEATEKPSVDILEFPELLKTSYPSTYFKDHITNHPSSSPLNDNWLQLFVDKTLRRSDSTGVVTLNDFPLETGTRASLYTMDINGTMVESSLTENFERIDKGSGIMMRFTSFIGGFFAIGAIFLCVQKFKCRTSNVSSIEYASPDENTLSLGSDGVVGFTAGNATSLRTINEDESCKWSLSRPQKLIPDVLKEIGEI